MGFIADAQIRDAVTARQKFNHVEYYGRTSPYREYLYVVSMRYQSFLMYIFDYRTRLWFGNERFSFSFARPYADVQLVTSQDMHDIYTTGGYVNYCAYRATLGGRDDCD